MLSAKGWELSHRVWFWTGGDAVAGWQVRTLQGHSNRVTSVAISVDGKRVVSASWDNTVKIWDAETRAEVKGFD